ncbi:glucuronyl esterase domain-containing protein [Paenibacillus kobensis]|uniref:glucuronyl esterase domain-containing protein n=1 Tax=Paenibacillus kobensis TaxID=59841 RepID=UPI000FDBF5A5|nr:hypothetical protein [Paenibacillus kobensis]
MSRTAQKFVPVSQLPTLPDLPDIFTFRDGSKVATAEDWYQRAEELKALYQHYMYGYLPDASEERVTYRRTETGLIITVTVHDMAVSYPVEVSLPGDECVLEGPYPVIFTIGTLEAWRPGGITDTDYVRQANRRGYAVVTLKTALVASDNAERTGAFFELYPYSSEPAAEAGYDSGVLVAWGWGAGKVLDALEQGAYDEIDPVQTVITGFSRCGKSALIAGALDERFAIVNSHCSGAGGIASFRRSFGGKQYAWGVADRSEGLEVLQCDQEAHWFNSVFSEFKDVEKLPFDQHELAALIAPRALLVTAGYADYWTNPEGMYISYAEAAKVYDFLGIGGQIGIGFRPGGHARSQEDIDNLLDFCDYRLRGMAVNGRDFKSSLYE